jgi:hypothetical protein
VLVRRILDHSDNKLEASRTSPKWFANRKSDMAVHGTNYIHVKPLYICVVREWTSVKDRALLVNDLIRLKDGSVFVLCKPGPNATRRFRRSCPSSSHTIGSAPVQTDKPGRSLHHSANFQLKPDRGSICKSLPCRGRHYGSLSRTISFGLDYNYDRV